jgi:hypothetical protein
MSLNIWYSATGNVQVMYGVSSVTTYNLATSSSMRLSSPNLAPADLKGHAK